MASKELFDVDNSLRDVQGLIAYCARVSNPNNQSDKKTTGKLIKYLIKNKHWSPLEMVSACIEIETTRDIARQILRHRSFSFQEFSQRYADPKEQARAVLPEGNTVSRMYMNGTLRSWVHYIELRSANGTQKEHMDVAKACAVEIAQIFPLIGDILND